MRLTLYILLTLIFVSAGVLSLRYLLGDKLAVIFLVTGTTLTIVVELIKFFVLNQEIQCPHCNRVFKPQI